MLYSGSLDMDIFKSLYPEKFAKESEIFKKIHRGSSIFIGSACAEPQYLVNALVKHVESYTNEIFGAEIIHIWTLGKAPYIDENLKRNFRHNSFFISDKSRDAVNMGLADYTPIFLSDVPELFNRGAVRIDVALIQTSPPDHHGNMSLGISVDIVKSAVENAGLVIAQVNSNMPRVHGDAFIHIEKVNYIIRYDEPLINFSQAVPAGIAEMLGKNVARIVQDGDTIQVGYGSTPNAILPSFRRKKNLGVHTELLTDGIIDLMRHGVVNNTKKSVDRGKTVASFCMGSNETYEYIHDNPNIELRTIDYTNSPYIISMQSHMTAINSALVLDLTGQASAETIGNVFYSGTGGQTNFMRGAGQAHDGKTILVLRSTSTDGRWSRIVPYLTEGAGITYIRGDIHYVVTEYGIAYLKGKSIRERAMALIAIAHPDFKGWLIEKAKEYGLIYKDQAFIPGREGEYPEYLESFKTAKDGLTLFLRPVKISDEDLLKHFFYSLSDKSTYKRFLSDRKYMPRNLLQKFCVIDYTREILLLAVVQKDEIEDVVGVGQYVIAEENHMADIAFAVRDDYQNRGIGSVLLNRLTGLAMREGLIGFTADVLVENEPMLRVFEKMGFDIEKKIVGNVYEIKMLFRGKRR